MYLFTDKDVKILESYGFVRCEAGELDEDDEDIEEHRKEQERDDYEYGVTYDLDLDNHNFLERVRISVNHNINVRCDENEFGHYGGDSVLIIRKKFTHETLKAVLSFLLSGNEIPK